jgi:hypothetical protein
MKSLLFLASHGFPWSQAVISLISSFVGGLIAGFFAIRAQDKAIRAQALAAYAAEARQVEGILKAIEQELLVMDHWLVSSLLQDMEHWDQQQPLNVLPFNQDLFTIYDANAAAVGRIASPELQRLIVTTYTQAKNLVDLVNQNAERYKTWDQLRHGTGTDPSRAQLMRDDLLSRARMIKRMTLDFKSCIAATLGLLKRINA